MEDVLEGVVALVVCRDPTHTAKPAIQRTLQQLGAKVVTRLSKEVSHIVYERRQAQRPRDGKDGEAELQELYNRADKLDPRPMIVSPSWVEESRLKRRRLVERGFVIARPKEALLSKPVGRTPQSGAGQGKKRKQAVALPKPAEAFDLRELFTSSQQIQGGAPDAGEEVTSPDAGQHAAKRPKKGDTGASRGKAPAPKAAEPLGKGNAGRSSLGMNGTETQQVADIMTGLLGGGGRQADTPGMNEQTGNGWEEGEDLDTPLSLRLAKSVSRSAGKDQRHSGAVGRSRLAQASGPHAEAHAGEGNGTAAVGAGQQEKRPQDSEAAGAAAKGAQGVKPPATKGTVQPAQRYSSRQLSKLEEKPLVLHKGTPLPGVLPPPSDGKRHKPAIPVPLVERVVSPWQDAEQLPSQSQSQQSEQQHQQQQDAALEGRPGDAERPQQRAGHQQQQHPGHCRALLHNAVRNASPNSSFKPPGPATGAAVPWSAQRPWDQKQQQKPVPQASPAGDVLGAESGAKKDGDDGGERGAAARAAADVADRRVLQEKQPQPGAAPWPAKQAKQSGEAAAELHQSEQQRNRRQRGGARIGDSEAAGEEPADDEEQGQGAGEEEGDAGVLGPAQHGYIAVTSVDPGVPDLVKAASRRLRGLRLCSEGHEDSCITHLVIGKERRTLKLMLAVANGAWLVRPEWVTASLEAGCWLPESHYLAEVRFVAAAERARCQQEVPEAPALLADQSIYLHISDARKAQGGNAVALKRVALALGAKLVHVPKACTLCVVVGGSSRPASLPKQVPAVKEEWLLTAAERYEAPSTSCKEFALR